ncbi:hypothetical protein FRAHR75_480021 [Frankia sp. Hr75.2]|nr:hypothetical protein FRAHR75_480021 [Frankia sp. Hr75.2]SQD99539.1 hypothetical protein FMEAI12_5370006 [Parafrankia sp. Ea1.12]
MSPDGENYLTRERSSALALCDSAFHRSHGPFVMPCCEVRARPDMGRFCLIRHLHVTCR